MSGTRPPPAQGRRPAPTAGRHGGRVGPDAGFTLVELLVVAAILGTLAALALPRLTGAIYQAQIARAISEIKLLETELYDYWTDEGELPEDLAALGRDALMDPWGNGYRYVAIAVSGKGPNQGQLRKDRFLVPLNTDFDLYSMGADGRTTAPLGSAAGRDDIVRANDGGFIGLASEY